MKEDLEDIAFDLGWPDPTQMLHDLYWVEDLHPFQIAGLVRCAESTLKRWMKDLGVRNKPPIRMKRGPSFAYRRSF